MKVKDLIRKLEIMGWELDRVKGSHYIFVHPKARRAIPVPVHGKEIPDTFAKAILKQAVNAIEEE